MKAPGLALDSVRAPRRGEPGEASRRPPGMGESGRERRASAARDHDENAEFRLSGAEKCDLARYLDPVEVFRAGGSEPYPWQTGFLRSRARYRLLVAPRQSGKSTCFASLAAHEAVFRAGVVLVVSVRQDQAGDLLRRIRSLVRAADAPVPIVSDAAKQLVLGNGGMVLSLPAAEGAIRGYSPSLILADEAARLPEALFTALAPSLASTRGRFVAASTPAGRRGWFYELWTNQEPAWERTRVRLLDCPQYAGADVEQLRRDLGERGFREEMEAEFLEDEEDRKNPRLVKISGDLLAAAFGGDE